MALAILDGDIKTSVTPAFPKGFPTHTYFTPESHYVIFILNSINLVSTMIKIVCPYLGHILSLETQVCKNKVLIDERIIFYTL